LGDAQMLTPGAVVGQLVESLIADLQSGGLRGPRLNCSTVCMRSSSQLVTPR
jgi:hypothetical protein